MSPVRTGPDPSPAPASA